MYAYGCDVLDTGILCLSNCEDVVRTLSNSFPINLRVDSTVEITINGNIPSDYHVFNPGHSLKIFYSALGDIESYGYHNAVKWVIRLGSWVLEKKGIVCLHAGSVEYNSSGVVIIGQTYRGGKTTICLHLTRKGGKYITDEYTFTDGFKILGLPQIKSHIRLGTLLQFKELRRFASKTIPSHPKELWFNQTSHAVRIPDIYGNGSTTTSTKPRILLVTNLSPFQETEISDITKEKAFEYIYVESMKHILKLVSLKEIDPSIEEISWAEAGLKQIGLECEKRRSIIWNFLNSVDCFLVKGGKDFKTLLSEIDNLTQSYGR